MFSHLRSFLRWALVSFIVATSCSATTTLSHGYSIRVWQTEDGLPQNTVTSAVQTHDGYLWFGTHSGLARFDGERFQVFDSANTPELPDRQVTSLFEDARGMLWIGQENGMLTRYKKGRFERVSVPSNPGRDRIIGIGSDEQGRLWAMRLSGAVDSLDDGHRLPSLIPPEEHPSVMSWSRNEQGNIWLLENYRAFRLEHGQIVRALFDPPRDVEYLNALASSRDGGAWAHRDGLIRKWNGTEWVEDRGAAPQDTVASCVELQDGTLAIGTVNTGLYLIFGDGRPTVHLDQSNGLPQNWVRFLYEDRERNLWIGTGSAGLVAIRPTAFSVLNSPDHWQGYGVHCVAPGQNESLWIGTDGGGLYHYSAGQWSRYGNDEVGNGNPYIWSVTETPKGEVWMGNYWWGGPFRLEHGHFVRPPMVDEKSPPAFALMTDRLTGDLLVGYRDGLVRLHGDRSIRIIDATEFPVADAAALVQDQQGAIWCGFTQGGLARVADGQVTLFRRKDGLASESIQCLFSATDGALWIGTGDNGLSRYKNGMFSHVDMTHGLIDNAICHILDDGLGYFWLSTHHGLQRVAKTELNRCADRAIARLNGQVYDHNDGLPIIEFTGGLHAAGCMTPDGRLWFSSSKGVVGVDPARLQVNITLPPVVIESVLVDGQPAPMGEEPGSRRLPPDHQRLEFRFSGLSYVAPNKVFFKYRLEGIDRTWVDAGTKRTAFYSRLPAGDYRFRVIACNNDGLWNTEGVTLAFTVLPFFWETWWFVSSCALLVVIGVAVLVRYVTRRRLQKRMEQLERQHALERERARIAQDIHDDVGTSLIRIAMFSQPERNEIDQPQQTAAVLSRIYSTAREMTRALDEIVWAIDPRHDTLDSLIGYMGRFAQELLGAANLRCRLDVPVEVPAWPLTAETRHNLFLAFKEALTNVIKHAGATEVRLTLEARRHEFALLIKDNGRGFDREQPASKESGRIASGNGLRNIERRLALIGGRFELSSAFGKGTTISFVIPVQNQVAFETHRPAGAPQ